MTRLEAVVWDFDGTIIDSETVIYRGVAGVLAQMGHTLTIAGWGKVVGRASDESFEALCAVVGAPIDRAEYEAAEAAIDRSAYLTIPIQPGVVQLLDDLELAGIPSGIASSSPASWIHPHLERLGLAERFSVVIGREEVNGVGKPAPDSYLLACKELGVEPVRAAALEDSSPGVAAARAAGLLTVAVPSHITVHSDLSAAHRSVASLEELSAAQLQAWVAARDHP